MFLAQIPRVIIESPFAGDTLAARACNVHYARRALGHSISLDEAPIASHLLYTQVLDDDVTHERAKGINLGHAWLHVADLMAVYEDLGVSSGMRLAIDRAARAGLPVQFRRIGTAGLAPCP